MALLLDFIKLIDDQTSQINGNSFQLTENQAKSILELRLHRLTSLEREDIKKDLEKIVLEIKGFLDILSSRKTLLEVIKKELKEIKEEFSTPRRSEIIDKEYEQIEDINYIQKEDIIITISNNGYIKRSLLENYRAQNRGGKGKTVMSTREEDFVKEIHLTDTHTKLLVFSTFGKVYALKAYNIPEALWRVCAYDAIEGRMIFFPSWLPHGVDLNMNTEKGEKNWRISVSYNFIQI